MEKLFARKIFVCNTSHMSKLMVFSTAIPEDVYKKVIARKKVSGMTIKAIVEQALRLWLAKS
tara:strand:+ start:957 stop:1142 length:186 start_codon:yes stop_codon:yes gene_type:complete